MNKLNTYFLIAISILLSHFTLTAQTFEVKYYLSDFTITRGADSLVTVTSKNRSFFAGDLQAPQLPFLSANILCTQGTTECNPVFSYEKEPIATGVLLNTIPPVYPTSIDPSTIDYTPQIARTSQSKPYNYEGVGKMMGYSFARIALSPFEYDYYTRTLYFIKSFVITLNERVPQQKASARNGSTATPPLGDPFEISNIVINAKEVSSMYPISSIKQNSIIFRNNGYIPNDTTISSENEYAGQFDEVTSDQENRVDYLIITSAALKQAFMPFVKWKRQKGLSVAIETVESIYSKYNESSDQLSIKRCIQHYYLNFGLQYVLIGGDIEIVPAQDCRIWYITTTEQINKTTPCDLFYATMDEDIYTFNWDNDNNGICGDVYDRIDFDADIYLGRVPVKTNTEVSNLINKIINYEKRPYEANAEYARSHWLLAGYDYGGIGNRVNPNLSDAHYDSYELMYKQNLYPYAMLDPDYLFDTGCYFLGQERSNRINNVELTFALSRGYSVVHIASHGSPNAYLDLNGNSFFNKNDISNLSNNHPSIIVTTACYTNAFDENISLSEAFIKKASGGAIAYFGSSRDGFATRKAQTVSNSIAFSTEFIKALSTTSDSFLGRALLQSRANNQGGLTDSYSKCRWIYLASNLLGDPEMWYFRNYNGSLSVNINDEFTDSIKVTLPSNAPQNTTIVLMSSDDSGEYYYEKSILNPGESYIFTPKTDATQYNLILSVTKHGYVPFFKNIVFKKIDYSNLTLQGPLAVVGNTYYDVMGLAPRHIVDWHFNKLNQRNSQLENSSYDDAGIFEIPELYLHVDSSNTSSCCISEGMISEISDRVSVYTITAKIKRNNNVIAELSKNIAKIFGYGYTVYQEATLKYPGFGPIYISDNLEYVETITPGIEDSAMIMQNRAKIISQQIEKSQKLSNPIFIYPEGTVFVESNNLKYCERAEYNYCIPHSFEFDRENAVVTFESNQNGDFNQSLLLEMFYGESSNPISLSFVQTENHELSISILSANNNYVSVAICHDQPFISNMWYFEVVSLATQQIVYTSSGSLVNDKFTISGYNFGNNYYCIRAYNEVDGIDLRTKCHTSYF